jgi:hypothetical protein
VTQTPTLDFQSLDRSLSECDGVVTADIDDQSRRLADNLRLHHRQIEMELNRQRLPIGWRHLRHRRAV